MSENQFDKIRQLAEKTRASFNLYASMDPASPEVTETLKKNGVAYYALYREITDSMNIPSEIADTPDLGMIALAETCDDAGQTDLANQLRLYAKITVEILEEMNLPEGTCPTLAGTQAATAKIIARYPKL